MLCSGAATPLQPLTPEEPHARAALRAEPPLHSTQYQPLAAPSLPTADVVDFRGYFKVETFANGAVIYRPGMPADKVFLLRGGRVRLLRQGKGKSRSVMSILKPGDLFGEVLRPEGSVMEELSIASGKCEVWSIEGRDFRALLEARPALAVDVAKVPVPYQLLFCGNIIPQI